MRTVSALILSVILFVSADAVAGVEPVFSGEEDTLSLHGRLSSELLMDPSGANSFRNIIKLLELSRDAGRAKTSGLFRKCAAKLADGNGGGSPEYFVLSYYAEYLERDPGSSDPLYKGVDKWLLSGPWQRYGRPDLYSPFQPEVNTGFSVFKAVRAPGEGRRIYPFGFLPERRGIVYAAASFSADVPVRIWIVSNGSYRLFVNGAEVAGPGTPGAESLTGIMVKGAREYTLLVKTADNRDGEDTYFRVILTDTDNRELKPDISGAIHTGGVTAEKIFSSCDIRSTPGFEGGAGMKKIRGLEKNNINSSYAEAKALLAQYPLCGDSYHTLMPILVKRGGESEFRETVNEYRERFPDSEYYLKWESDFYRESDAAKFAAAMERIHPSICELPVAGAYIKLLAERGENKPALSYSGRFGDVPSFRGLVSGIERSVSTPVQWRKYLLEKMTATGDPLYFYLMGNADMDAGLDPILYWEKALSIRSDMRDLREAADIFENGGGKGSLFYSGRYTDFHPEFLWNGIKRRVTVRIFANGKYMAECEELIPQGLASKGEFTLMKLKDLRVIYALRCGGGEAVPVEFETAADRDGRARVKLKSADKADFVVLKYTGYSGYEEAPFYIMKGMELRGEDEDISEIMLEVISEAGRPAVTFMDKTVTGEKNGNEGETVYRSSARFNYKESGRVTVSAANISSDSEFSSWYSGMLRVVKKRGTAINIPEPGSVDIQGKIADLEGYVNKNFTVDGGVSFEPRFPDEVIFSQHGTSEELAILSSAILEKNGVKGFIAFIREKGESVSGSSEAALYVPESRDRGYWIRFADRKNFKNAEALIIRGERFEIVPVSN